MRESLIESKVCAHAESKGWLVHPKAAAGTRGWPDRTFSIVRTTHYTRDIVSRTAVLRFIEFKAPGQKPTKLQQHVHKQLRDQGYEVHVVDSIEAGYAIFA